MFAFYHFLNINMPGSRQVRTVKQSSPRCTVSHATVDGWLVLRTKPSVLRASRRRP